MNNAYKKESLFEEVTPYNTLEMINARGTANNEAFQGFPGNAANTFTADIFNGIAAQNNQFNIQAMTEIQHLTNDKFMLQMTIERMKRIRQEIPNEYSINSEGAGVCIKPNGVRIPTGKIRITSVAEYRICKNGKFNDFIVVFYIDSKDCKRTAVIPVKNLAGKNLVSSFAGFEYICKKDIANEFLTWYITNFYITTAMIIPEFAGFVTYTENNKEKAAFICNDGTFNTELLQCCSENIIRNTLPCNIKTIAELNEYAGKYLDTPQKCLLFTYSICGLLSSLLEEINTPMSQILVIFSSNADIIRQICYYLKIFSRDRSVISFDTNKATIRKTFHNAKDETIIINDCSIVDNEKRRLEMLQYVLTLDTDNETNPHNTVIISGIAQCLMHKNQKICMNPDSDFYNEMTQEQEKEMCYALDCITRYIVDLICNNYGSVKDSIKEYITTLNEKSRGKNLSCMQSRTSYSVLAAIFFMLKKHLNIPVNSKDIADLLFSSLDMGSEITGDSDDAVVNEFTNILNKRIRSEDIKIILHSKDMNFTSGQPCVIVKDNLIVIEEKTITDIILEDMTTTNSVHKIVKSLENVNLLHSTKKNRYPLTVYILLSNLTVIKSRRIKNLKIRS